jgi:hypothetical protein
MNKCGLILIILAIVLGVAIELAAYFILKTIGTKLNDGLQLTGKKEKKLINIIFFEFFHDFSLTHIFFFLFCFVAFMNYYPLCSPLINLTSYTSPYINFFFDFLDRSLYIYFLIN